MNAYLFMIAKIVLLVRPIYALILFLSIFVTIGCLFSLIRNRNLDDIKAWVTSISSKLSKHIVISTIIIVLLLIAALPYQMYTGLLSEFPITSHLDGEYFYYANVYDDSSDETVTVPVIIEKETETDPDENVTYTYYFLKEIVYPDFTIDVDNEDINPDKVNQIEVDDTSYEIELTMQKATIPGRSPSNKTTVWDFLLDINVAAWLVIILISTYMAKKDGYSE